MTNYAKEFRARENARLDRLEANCKHEYAVPVLVSVVPKGTPCAKCGKPYEEVDRGSR